MGGFMRPTTPEDVSYIAPRLRKADRAEIRALVGAPAGLVLPDCVKVSEEVWTLVTRDNEPAALWGIQPVLDVPFAAWVWMVGTDKIYEHRWDFLAKSKGALPVAHQRYPLLCNMVDERNEEHIKWLRFMGFKFLRRIETWGAEGRPFIEFARLEQNN